MPHAPTSRRTPCKRESRQCAAKRGYDRRWVKFRAWFLAQPDNVMCADCGTAWAREVHHKRKLVDAPELRLEPANCMALCKPCHSVRTARGE